MKTKTKAAAVEPPKKRQMPNMEGVPGEIVSLDGLSLDFSTHSGRKSPYDALLDQLAAAGAGRALKFGDARARTSVTARAKKKGLRVSFAENDGALYVRFEGHAGDAPKEPSVRDAMDDIKETRRERIRQGLKVSGGATPYQLTKLLLDKGDLTVDAHLVGAILTQMQRAGELVRGEGEIWRLNPAKRAA